MPRHACAWLISFLLLSGVGSAQTSTWTDPNQDITIPAGQAVTLDSPVARARSLTILGSLKVSRAVSTRLEIGCQLMVMGTFDAGTVADPIVNVTHETVFAQPIQPFVGGGTFQASDCGLHTMGNGVMFTHGRPIDRTWGKLAADAPAGATSLTLDFDVSDWRSGDEIVLTQTSTPWFVTYAASGVPIGNGAGPETEVRTIASVDGNVITLAAPVTFAHKGSGQERGEVGLISHNVTIRTAVTTANRRYAHVMIMDCGRAELHYTAFRHLGHAVTGRYAVHYHRTGNCANQTTIRGISIFESGNRALNLHESNGILVEDAVIVRPACVGIYTQTDAGSQQADIALIRNLVAGVEPGGCESAPTGFWIGTTQSEAQIGNVVAGFNPQYGATMGFYWATATAAEPISTAPGSFPRANIANEVHSIKGSAFKVWQNVGLSSNDDVVGTHAWAIVGEGISHGAYNNHYRWFNARLVNNFAGYTGLSIHGYLQDSIILGRGPNAVKRQLPDEGVGIYGYVVQPHPMHPWRVVRTHIAELTPDQLGGRAAGIEHVHTVCTVPASEFLILGPRGCTPTTLRITGVTFGAGLQPLKFGWTQNANAHWITDTAVLFRRDQRPALAPIPASLLMPATVYDADADALSTPISSLPATMTWLTPPHDPYVVTLAYDPPPTIALATSRTGSLVQVTATVSPDTTKVEFWRNHVKVGERTAAPWAWTVDLTDQTGDPLAAQHYHTVYARAFDGVVIDQGGNPTGRTDPVWNGYQQRTYSAMFQFGPEAAQTPVPDYPAQIAALEQQVAALTSTLATTTQQRDSATADLNLRQAQLIQAQSAVQLLQGQMAALQFTLGQETSARQAAEARLAQLRAAIQAALSQ